MKKTRILSKFYSLSIEEQYSILASFIDVMDGVKEHDIQGNTGLPDKDCKRIYVDSLALQKCFE